MKIIQVDNKKFKQDYINFIYQIYKGDSAFVDTSLFLVKKFLFKQDAFTKDCVIEPIFVKNEDTILCQCMLIYNKKMPALQVGFFESLAGQSEAVHFLLEYAKERAKFFKLNKIVIGLNGHISYGVGILTQNFTDKVSFDSLYNKEYYKNFFEDLGFVGSTLTAYKAPMQKLCNRIENLVSANADITVRQMDTRQFKKEMILLGEICNQTLDSTDLYFNTESEHMFELISEMKYFLTDKNILFAMKDGKEIGFIFWHEDYNQTLKPSCRNGLLKIALSYTLNKKYINTIKINAVGVKKPYQNGSCILTLLKSVADYTRLKYDYVETNFVWDSNIKSSLLNKSIGMEQLKKYAVYNLEVE